MTATQLAAGSVTAAKMVAGTITAVSGIIADAAITSAKIADTIQSTGFVSGVTGWQIQKNGAAEFNGPVIARQLQVDTGTFTLPPSIPAGTGDTLVQTAEFWIETNTPAAAWAGTKETFMALVGREGASGSVSATSGNISGQPEAIQWGWEAHVVPITRWSGDQRLWIRVVLHTRNVLALSNFVLRWRLIKVT